ncbi:vWA domain-containing protein [Rhodopirellula sp. JC639]|uniref:vWA domain-containing protein n=1 Tax=Stieleria mannarensis TaxID=2755585 RepID=UPI001600F149|nr:vWA domain-containing protein [Rhodopirellula sp. JC639]
MSTSPLQPTGKTTQPDRKIWQGDRAGGADIFAILWRRWRQVLWGVLLLAALLLFAWLIWLLLLSPKRTPMVVLSAAEYTWPLPPNAWAKEDFERLSVMDGETITVRGDGDPIFKAADFYQRLEREVARAQGQSRRLPLIVWVSLHGIADRGDESIRLIPPKASPTDPQSWIDVHELLDRIEPLGADRKALLILDCNRMPVNWNIGLRANQFAEKVQAAFTQRVAENKTTVDLAVMLSAGPDETSYVSADLAGSVFGHYLQLGLAGAADQVSHHGNGDGWVDLGELHRYVQTQVNWWARQSRGDRQTPVLMKVHADSNFHLARSLNPERLNPLIRRPTLSRPGPSISDAQLDSLWRSLDEIRAQQLYRSEPIAFRDVEHSLLWLEQLATAGKGYQTLAKRTFNRVVGEIKAMETRIARLPQSPTYPNAYSLVSGNRPPLPRALRVHSLPLAEFFGTQDVTSSTQLRDRLQEFSTQPNAELLSSVRADLEKLATSDYRSTQFARMLNRYQTPGLWQQADVLGKLLTIQAEIEDRSVPRDEDGIPADLRVHRWTRWLLGPAESWRRTAEDRVILRQQEGLAESIQETQSRYSASMDALATAITASRISDRAMAVAPYYAQWIAHPDRASDPAETKADIENLIVPLIRETERLAAQLDAIPASTDDQALIETLRGIAALAEEQIRPTVDGLQEKLTLRTRQLIRESLTNQLNTVGEIQAVLSVPLVDWESRRDLRTAMNELTARVHINLEPPSEDEQVDSTGPAELAYSARIESWQQHPLNLLLGETTDDGANTAETPIASFLDSVARQMQGMGGETTLSGQRNRCATEARRTRAAASIWFPRPTDDPIAVLRDIDIKALLMWHAERSLADFWGPAGGERPFYDLAVTDYLASVDELDRQGTDSASGDERLVELVEAQSQLEASRRFLPGWLTTMSARTIQLDPQDDVRSSLVIRSESDREFTPPMGTAVVSVRNESRRIDFESIQPSDAVTLPTSGASYEVVLPADVSSVGLALKAHTVFRGHEYGGPLNLEQLGGVRIDVHPHRYQKSEVTLNGPWDELSVVFVLDCSASMAESLEGNADGVASRMEIAKASLQEMLFDLGLRRNVRVGVRAFGHRLGWSVDEPVRPLTRPDFGGVIDPTVTPERDVESMLRLSDFDLAAAQSLVPEIGQLKPWGQSPLYLSVMQAIQEFSADDATADRHIIAITDGANYQFIPPSAIDSSLTTDNDVRQAWMQTQVPVHILGLGMDRSRQQDALQEFDRLSRDTGGRFQALASSTDLKQALRNLLAPGMYRLRSYHHDQRPDVPITLGSPSRVLPAPDTPELFALQYEGRQWVDTAAQEAPTQPLAIEPLVLEGGEAYQLYVSKAGTEIYDYPYDDNVEAMAELMTPHGAATDQVIRVHRPKRQPPDYVAFPVSWQRREPVGSDDRPRWRATRRPSAVWIHLQPVTVDGQEAGPAYTFYDTTFEPSEPVPVMNLLASGWPHRAVKARLRVWSRPAEESAAIELLPPGIASGNRGAGDASESNRLNRMIPVDESSDEPIEVTPGIRVRIDPLGTTFADGVARRRYVVNFDDPDVPVTSIKVSLDESIDEKPTRIVRQFDPQRRMSVHTFYYPTRTNAPVRQIHVTNQADEIDGAWQLDRDGVEVVIPDAGGLLPVGR